MAKAIADKGWSTTTCRYRPNVAADRHLAQVIMAPDDPTRLPSRLGNITSVEDVAGLDVAVIDLSGAEDAANSHLAAATSPSVIAFLKGTEAIRRGLETDASGRTGLLPGTVLLAQEATAVIMAPVAAVEAGLR